MGIRIDGQVLALEQGAEKGMQGGNRMPALPVTMVPALSINQTKSFKFNRLTPRRDGIDKVQPVVRAHAGHIVPPRLC